MAQARLARVQLAREMTGDQTRDRVAAKDFPSKVNPETVTLARKAYREEPLAVDALSIIAIAYNAQGRDVAARSTFAHVHTLSRRDETASLWLALDAARRDDVRRSIGYFDELLRTSSVSRGLLLQRLAVSSGVPQLRGALLEKIRANPPWLSEFWTVGSSNEASAQPIGQLVQALGPEAKLTPEAREALAVNLLKRGDILLARNIYRAFSGAQTIPLVINFRFQQPSYFPPIDWQTYSTGNYSAEIAPSDAVMYVSATGYPGAVAARQFVSLSPGRYRLAASGRLFALGEDERVLVRLSCRLDASLKPVELTLAQGASMVEFVAPAGCAGYFLDVVPVTSEGTSGFDAEITSIDITRL